MRAKISSGRKRLGGDLSRGSRVESVRTTRSRKSGLYWTLQIAKKEMFRFTFFRGGGEGVRFTLTISLPFRDDA